MYLFVYGTLKRNHHFVPEGSYAGEDRTQDSYCMYDLGDFPGVAESPAISPIYGETYEVDRKTLSIIDDFEGRFYRRKEIMLASGTEAHIYFLEIPHPDFPVITGGNWNGNRDGENL
jgi:gamma-glutamylcyclotransferase (GGCT)/AIG2-like uncharacterized protein YtfP